MISEFFVDFLELFGLQAKRILFESNKIGCFELNCSALTVALKKKETRLQSNRVSKNKLWEIKYGNHKN